MGLSPIYKKLAIKRVFSFYAKKQRCLKPFLFPPQILANKKEIHPSFFDFPFFAVSLFFI
jgi:hypothetical protein